MRRLAAAVRPDLENVEIGVSRTQAPWKDFPELRQGEAATLAAIAAAKTTLYIENQYFTSPVVAEAIAQRLDEADGPEVILVSTQHSPSWFDQMTMDKTRSAFLKRLEDADRHGRFSPNSRRRAWTKELFPAPLRPMKTLAAASSFTIVAEVPGLSVTSGAVAPKLRKFQIVSWSMYMKAPLSQNAVGVASNELIA
ncbi:hypothetical protein ABIC32_001030 [Brevundimonas sp. 1080]